MRLLVYGAVGLSIALLAGCKRADEDEQRRFPRRALLESDSAVAINLPRYEHLLVDAYRWDTRNGEGPWTIYVRSGFLELRDSEKEEFLAVVRKQFDLGNEYGQAAEVMDSTGDTQYGVWIWWSAWYGSVGDLKRHRLADIPKRDSITK